MLSRRSFFLSLAALPAAIMGAAAIPQQAKFCARLYGEVHVHSDRAIYDIIIKSVNEVDD